MLLAALILTSSLSISSSDERQFGYFWEAIREEKHLDLRIEEASHLIYTQRERWRNRVELLDPFMELELSGSGMGGTYFLGNLLVIKPEDENVLALNNPKHYASPLIEHRPRQGIPSYQSSQRDALCYEVAKILGLERITPKVCLGIVRSAQFFGSEKEKFCSIQNYQQNTTSLYDHIRQDGGLEFNDFEMANIYVWIIFDNDAHPKNFHLTESRSLIKIDNSLTFPETNSHLFNFLPHLPQGEQKLSPEAKYFINHIPLTQIEEAIHYFELSPTIPALRWRITLLQQLALQDLTIREIDEQLCSLKE